MPREPFENFETTAQRSADRERLLRSKIVDLHLKLEGTRLEKLIQRLYSELEAASITLRPPVYLSDEWGCPDGSPLIGIPFYLADEKLTQIEDEMMDWVEAESDEEIMRYLRHEAGHAFNYAYRLYETDEWHKRFGPFSRPYVDDYTPDPFSHNYVRHLPGWYAQKHPDEDCAETFAVWLTPESNWRENYRNWGCFPKLLYIDETVKKLGRTQPLVSSESYNRAEEALNYSLADYYERLREDAIEIPPYLDNAIRDIFATGRKSKDARLEASSASAFIDSHRRAIVTAVVYWTGLNDNAVRGLIRHIRQRCQQMDIPMRADGRTALVELVVLITVLCMNKLHKGQFISR